MYITELHAIANLQLAAGPTNGVWAHGFSPFDKLSVDLLCSGMKIATYANARTALEARKGVAPAFMCGE